MSNKLIKDYLPVIRSNSLFEKFSDTEILTILPCVEGTTGSFKSGDPVILAGDIVKKIGIVLDGELSIIEYDINGNKNLISKLKPGDVFAEAMVVLGAESKIAVEADSPSTVLFLSYHKIITSCSNACEFHTRLINNLIKTLAAKLYNMQTKLAILHKNSIRTKLETFFEICARENKSNTFTMPLNKSELAEYIGVNRSAMHRELKNMEEESLIEINGKEVTYMPK